MSNPQSVESGPSHTSPNSTATGKQHNLLYILREPYLQGHRKRPVQAERLLNHLRESFSVARPRKLGPIKGRKKLLWSCHFIAYLSHCKNPIFFVFIFPSFFLYFFFFPFYFSTCGRLALWRWTPIGLGRAPHLLMTHFHWSVLLSFEDRIIFIDRLDSSGIP